MALLIAFDDAKKNQFRREPSGNDGRSAGALRTPFFGSRDNPDLPLATLNQHDPGRFSGTHFHRVDQFQVIVDGKGKIGRHDVAPFAVHFTRAYTPYGPVLSDGATGLTFFVLRARSDTGSLHLPEEQDQLNRVPDRQPWQITRHAVFPTLQSDTVAADVMLQTVPGLEDQEGLAAYTLSMKPNAKALAPDPSRGGGQYLVVVKGSLLHDQKEHRAWALVFVRAEESPFRLHAGTKGLEALVLNFPRGLTRTAATDKRVRATMSSTLRQCALCAFVYDEAAGVPAEGIAPGTRWQDVPETWSCPDCNASKASFCT